MADRVTAEDLDLLADTDPLRLRDEAIKLLTEVEQLRLLVRDLTDDSPCFYDHHGGCQTHGYLSLEPGEECPHAEARSLLGLDPVDPGATGPAGRNRHPMTHYAIVETLDPPHDTLTGGDYLMHNDPRRIDVTELIGEGKPVRLAPLITGIPTPPGRPIHKVVAVTPLGPVTAVEDEDGGILGHECWEGWDIAETVPVDGLLGPQARTIIDAVQLAETVLDGTDSDPRAARYYARSAADCARIEHARDSALNALDRAGIDSEFWNHAFTSTYGDEIIAFAAFDLIGTVETWTRDAFDIATAPWRAAFPSGPGTDL